MIAPPTNSNWSQKLPDRWRSPFQPLLKAHVSHLSPSPKKLTNTEWAKYLIFMRCICILLYTSDHISPGSCMRPCCWDPCLLIIWHLVRMEPWHLARLVVVEHVQRNPVHSTSMWLNYDNNIILSTLYTHVYIYIYVYMKNIRSIFTDLPRFLLKKSTNLALLIQFDNIIHLSYKKNVACCYSLSPGSFSSQATQNAEKTLVPWWFTKMKLLWCDMMCIYNYIIRIYKHIYKLQTKLFVFFHGSKKSSRKKSSAEDPFLESRKLQRFHSPRFHDFLAKKPSDFSGDASETALSKVCSAGFFKQEMTSNTGYWLVVEPTHLKNMRSQLGKVPQRWKIENNWNHHLIYITYV